MISCATTRNVVTQEKVPEFDFPFIPEINEKQIEFIYDGKVCTKVTIPYWYFIAWLEYGSENEDAIAAFEEYRKKINGEE